MQRKRILAILLVLGFSAFHALAAFAWERDFRAPIGFTLHQAAKPLGDIRFLDAQGRVVHLADFKGRMVLINLWATWCPSCRLELPALDRLQDMLGKEGLTVLAVSMDKKGLPLVASFYRESQIAVLPMFFDPAWELRKSLSVEGLPASVLIGRDGWEVGRAEGWHNWTSSEMLVFMRNLLQED